MYTLWQAVEEGGHENNTSTTSNSGLLTPSQCVRAAEDRSRWKQLVSQAMVADDYTWSAKKKKK